METVSSIRMEGTQQTRLRWRGFILLGVISSVLLLYSRMQGFDLIAHPLFFAAICFGLGLVFSGLVLFVSVASCISEEIVYLAAETAHEVGTIDGDVSEATVSIKELLEFYEDTLQRRFMSRTLIRLLGVTKALQWAGKTLSDPILGNSIESVRQVGIRLARLCEFLHERHFGFLFFYRPAAQLIDSDPNRAEAGNKAIENFHFAVEKLATAQSFSNAHQVCLLSRRAGAMLHCSWPEYQRTFNRTPTLLRFGPDLHRALSLTLELATRSTQKESGLLKEYAASMERRQKALDALLNNNRHLLWATLHGAIFKSKSSNLLHRFNGRRRRASRRTRCGFAAIGCGAGKGGCGRSGDGGRHRQRQWFLR
jgi:hypothetical protein